MRNRESGRFDIDGKWFQYGRKQGIVFANKEKITQPDISMGGNFAYDENGEFYQTTTLYGYIKYPTIKESYKFYMAIFNSQLLWWYLKQTGTVLANGYFRFMPRYVETFPLPKVINLDDIKPFEKLVNKILTAKKDGKDTSDYETKIDQMVYKIYKLSTAEIKIIEAEK